MNLDRFSESTLIADPQELEVEHYCAGCGGEIYTKEPRFNFNGDRVHKRKSCAYEFLEIHGDEEVA
jgi:hypothetical protein